LIPLSFRTEPVITIWACDAAESSVSITMRVATRILISDKMLIFMIVFCFVFLTMQN